VLAREAVAGILANEPLEAGVEPVPDAAALVGREGGHLEERGPDFLIHKRFYGAVARTRDLLVVVNLLITLL
jgi:hypothetical protein